MRAPSTFQGPVGGDEPAWYKDAVIYQVHVRAFADSNGDGIGDFRGLAGRLDYLHDLGISAIWLQPFYPSPLRDDGYDISDYTDVHPDYGTVEDFRLFLQEAHRRGLRVITELVLNHSSDQHPWFQRARRAAEGSAHRDFYVWSRTRDRYTDARIIFKDFVESNWSWDPVARAYYWHRFYHHQPDLNFDNPAVRKAFFGVVDFWLGLGVDGLRLDAVPYLFEREGTNCENLPETHEFLRELRRYVDSRHPNRMLLAEANQWPEDAVAYFGRGDECHMAFHFPVMPRLFMAMRMEDRFPIVDILEQTPPIPESAQWAVFLRNHDELTLEMVTDEERDYMYRVYAHDPRARINLGIRHRLAPLLENNRRRIELMNGLLFSLPGTPVLYYGDEIGMGDNIYLGDRNGVRTPMQWSADRNAGFSQANPQRLYLPIIIDPAFHYEAVNVEVQQENPSSLVWWMKRLVALRKRYRAFGRGTMEFLHPENRKVLAVLRRHEEEAILAVANLSRYSQYVELPLAEFRGIAPVELFGQTEFPRIGELPYLLTMGPHTFYWFSLGKEEGRSIEVAAGPPTAPPIHLPVGWEGLFEGEGREGLERVLPEHLAGRRWFAGKARRVRGTRIRDVIPLENGPLDARLLLVTVDYKEGDPETYFLPLACSAGEQGAQILERAPQEVVARLSPSRGERVLHGALADGAFAGALLEAIGRRRRMRGEEGDLHALPTRVFRKIAGTDLAGLEPSLLRGEQSNSSVLFGDRLILKLFRKVDEGINPDLEIGRFLTERAGFPHSPPVAGALEYRPREGQPMTLGILQGFVPNGGDAWSLTLDVLGRYYERVALCRAEAPPPLPSDIQEGGEAIPVPEAVRERIGVYLEQAHLLGRRTAELHVALSSDPSDPVFAPEPFTPLYLRSLYQSMRNETVKVFDQLRDNVEVLPEEIRAEAGEVLAREKDVLSRYRSLLGGKIGALRTRIHGDFHLGQVLHTGKDFVIIDFEGEPSRSLGFRRIKRSPLRDVAGMLRSFHYAAQAALEEQVRAGIFRREMTPVLQPWVRAWVGWVSWEFLRAYRESASPGGFLPGDSGVLHMLLRAYLLEKAVYELGYELGTRPAWLHLPIRGIREILEGPA